MADIYLIYDVNKKTNEMSKEYVLVCSDENRARIAVKIRKKELIPEYTAVYVRYSPQESYNEEGYVVS